MTKEIVVVIDVDGCLTDGAFYVTPDFLFMGYRIDGLNVEKFMKKFGPDDWDALKELGQRAKIKFITGDKRGYSIVEKRLVDQCGFDLSIVSVKPVERWRIIKRMFPNHTIVYIGDGLYDWLSLKNSDYGITTIDALKHVKQCADLTIFRKGGYRFIAEACIAIMLRYNLINNVWELGRNE